MYDTFMVITCYVHRGKGFKLISLSINFLSGTLHHLSMNRFEYLINNAIHAIKKEYTK